MSHEEKVVVKIKNDGSGVLSFDCNGFIGEGCDVIKDIENALGTVTYSEMKEEAHLFENPDPAFNELAM